MGRMTYTCGISEDREPVLLQMNEDDKPLAHMLFDGASAEGLIRDLAKCRGALNEKVAPELDPGARVSDVEVSPSWRVPGTHSGADGTLLLALRHAGLGWIGFLFREAEARAIGKALTEIAPKGKAP